MLKNLLHEGLLLESQFGTLEKLLKPETPPAFKNALKGAIDKVLSMDHVTIQQFRLNGPIIDENFFKLDLPFDYILFKLEDDGQFEWDLTPEQKNLYDLINNKYHQQMEMINDSFNKLRVFNMIIKRIVGTDNADTLIKILNLPQVKGDPNELIKLADLFEIINSKGNVNQNFSKKLDKFINNMLQLHIKWFNVPYRNQETVKPNIPIGTRILNYFDLFTILIDYINKSDTLRNLAVFSKLMLNNINFIDYLAQDFQNNLWNIFLKDESNFEFYKGLKAEKFKNSQTSFFAGYHVSFIKYCIANNHWIPMDFNEPNVKVFLLPTYEGTVMACNILPYETDYTSPSCESNYTDSVMLNPHFFVDASKLQKNVKLRNTTRWCVKAYNMWQSYSSRYWNNCFILILDNNFNYDDPAGAILTGLYADQGKATVATNEFMDAGDTHIYNQFAVRSYAGDLVNILNSLNDNNVSKYFSKNLKYKTGNSVNKINLYSDTLEKEIYEANLLKVLGLEITSDEKTKEDVKSNIFKNQLFELANLNNVAKTKDVFNHFFSDVTQIITDMLTQDTKIRFLKTGNNLVSIIELFNFFDLFNNFEVNYILSDVVLDEYTDNYLNTIKQQLLSNDELQQLSDVELVANLILFKNQPVESNFRFDINIRNLKTFNADFIKNKIEEIRQLYIDRCISEFNSLTDDSIFNIVRELFYEDAYENDNNEVGEFFRNPDNTQKFIKAFFKVIQPLITNKINEQLKNNESFIDDYLDSIDRKITNKINEKLNSLKSIKQIKISQDLNLLNGIISKKFLTNKTFRKTTSSANGDKHIPISLLFQEYKYFMDPIEYKKLKNEFILPVLNYIKNLQFYVSDEFLNANFNENDKNIIIQHFNEINDVRFLKSIRSLTVDNLIEKISNEKPTQFRIHTFMFLLFNFFRMDSRWQTATLNKIPPSDEFARLTAKFGQIFSTVGRGSQNIISLDIDRFNKFSIFDKITNPDELKKIFIDAYQKYITEYTTVMQQGIFSFNTFNNFFSACLTDAGYTDIGSSNLFTSVNDNIYRTYFIGHPSVINYLNYLYSDDLGDIQSNFENLIRTKLNEFHANPFDIFSVSFISLLGLTLIFEFSFNTKELNKVIANILYNAILQIEQEKITNPNLDLLTYDQQMETVLIFFHVLENYEKIIYFKTTAEESIKNLLNTFVIHGHAMERLKKMIEMSGYVSISNKTKTIQNENINYVRRNQKIIISERDFRKLLLKLL